MLMIESRWRIEEYHIQFFYIFCVLKIFHNKIPKINKKNNLKHAKIHVYE